MSDDYGDDSGDDFGDDSGASDENTLVEEYGGVADDGEGASDENTFVDDGSDDGSDGDDSDDSDGSDDDDSDDDSDDNSDDDSEDEPDSDASEEGEVFGSRDDYPDADDSDFEDDQGDWTDRDYQESANALFGRNEYFGETAQDLYAAQGYQRWQHDSAWSATFDQYEPGAGRTVHFYERYGQVVPFGMMSIATLYALRLAYPTIDFGHVHVTVPPRYGYGNNYEVQPLPYELANVDPHDTVDLRKFCSPIGDQKQTSRCSAFAWTHALEMVGPIAGKTCVRLSTSFTMLQFQRMQGDAKDFAWAYAGGDGTNAGVEPGEVLVRQGSCRHELWPDDDVRPRTSEQEMARDATAFRLPARVQAIGLDDVRKVLSAGCPVHVSMDTGEAFAELGRDGVFHNAEAASGQHGRHAMLCVGYLGNYFVIKNSWGTDWGDRGYCYVPKKVLMAANAEFVAILFNTPAVGTHVSASKASGVNSNAAAPVAAAPVAVRCDYCGSAGTAGGRCANCFAPLPAASRSASAANVAKPGQAAPTAAPTSAPTATPVWQPGMGWTPNAVQKCFRCANALVMGATFCNVCGAKQ